MAMVAFIAWRKIPELLELPVDGKIGIEKPKFILRLEKRIAKIISLFKEDILLHKFLFSVKLIISKAEHKIDKLLQSVRKKAQQRRNK